MKIGGKGVAFAYNPRTGVNGEFNFELIGYDKRYCNNLEEAIAYDGGRMLFTKLLTPECNWHPAIRSFGQAIEQARYYKYDTSKIVPGFHYAWISSSEIVRTLLENSRMPKKYKQQC